MISVKFTVNGQMLKRITMPYLVRDSKNCVQLDFRFSEVWAEFEKKAIFDKKYEVTIENNSVLVPASVLKKPEFTVSVYGLIGADVLITTNEVAIELDASGYVADADFPPDTALEEYRKQIAELQGENEALETENSGLKATVEGLETDNAELTANVEGLTASNTELTKINETLTESNEALQGENASLETRVDELEASIKPEQEKAVTITENGNVDVLPDDGQTLSKVNVTVDVETGNLEAEATLAEIEGSIDESGVLDSTDGTATEKVEQLIEQSEQAKLWRDNLNSYSFVAYKGSILPEINLETLNSMTSFRDFCLGAYIENIDFYINGNNPTRYYQAFYGTTKLKKIKGCNTSNAYDLYWMFHQSSIEEIEMPFDLSKATNVTNAFATATSLKEIMFVEETIHISIAFSSSVLSTESIQSIIDGLATVETAHKLTLHTDIVTKLTEEQVVQIANKNWEVG